MIVTPYALIILVLGIGLLLGGSTLVIYSMFLLTTLFGGSAAFILVAAGGSSIPPAQFALGFLILRLLLPGAGQMERLREALWRNRFLLLFVGWGIVSAFTLPIVFAKSMQVTPLKPIPGADLFATVPLRPTSQNWTTAFYLTGTLFAGVASAAVAGRPGGGARLVTVGFWVAMFHGITGFASVLFRGTPVDSFLALFRNGSYAQLDQSFNGFVRMAGVWPEPSSYAAFASTWCIFMLELWFRGVQPRRTGAAGLLLLGALIFSTSSSAYVSLAAYSLFLMLRFAVAPGTLGARRHLAMLAIAFSGTALILTLLVIFPELAHRLNRTLLYMTVEKSESGSGVQRAFWAWQGVEVFMRSYGLGIGAGSFRSSSLLTAILGSMGLFGMLAFAAHLLSAVRPFAPSSWSLHLSTPDQAIGCAASSTSLVMLAPACVGAPSPDPGVLWAVMCGAALALRPAPHARQQLRRMPLHRTVHAR